MPPFWQRSQITDYTPSNPLAGNVFESRTDLTACMITGARCTVAVYNAVRI